METLTFTRPEHYLLDLNLLPLPTEDDLPSDDGRPMETERHKLQSDLLYDTLAIAWRDRADVHIGVNNYVYFSPSQEMNFDYRGPDFYVVLGVPRRERKSWLVWQEGKGPDLIIELLSPSTTKNDKGLKKEIYQHRLRVPEYFWYDPFTFELAGFKLENGLYRPIRPDKQGRFISHHLQLALVQWTGQYRDAYTTWLRWETLEGLLLPTGEERLDQEWERAEQEWERAEQERERAKQERERAEQERERAEQATYRVQELEAMLARYQAQFGQLPQT